MHKKYLRLKNILQEMESVLIGFSGGVDSAFLLKAAYDTLGNKVLAVTADSATLAPSELDDAKRIAANIGAMHMVVQADELESADFVVNPPDRCYHCKKTRFSVLKDIQTRRGLKWLADGTNADDDSDWRPGIKAGAEMGIRSPLKEAGLSKTDIRYLSASLGLTTWDKPSMACLASRVPYGELITKEKLNQIAEAEECLRKLGFRQFRVRHHGSIARVEVPKDSMGLAVRQSGQIVEKLKQIGFHFVTLDLAGFKSGSMNIMLDDTLTGQQ